MSVKSVLSGMEWDEGLQVPVANASNKQLEELLQKNQQEMTKLNLEVAQTEDRVFALQEHMRNVQQELNNTQGISRAREKEIETENHMLLVAQREEGRLKQEIQRLENNLADLQERKNIHEVR
ncbi:Coiled-coil domain-containing protein 39 [Holothuria leucospilota]|uniref:Coiled-coil domain-containing protein 39 n=1 Tax=Holothuria leucospilota TaxID=206669 RepID=A0A9Q1BU57_HOLLE|nr:Coiled-coil domain-containing protein 39 [Holothuria leucospilota]